MNPEKTKVILVGNSVFPNWGTENKNIPNVDQNIESLRNIFLNPIFFGLPDDQKHLVTIKDEESREILLKVKHETKSLPERDQFERLIFYYAGHGIPGEERKLFLASRDTIRGDYEITSVDSQKLFSYLSGFGARELIVILDCCYAAQSKENMGDADSLIEKCLPEEKKDLEAQENGTYYLFASGKDNVAKFNPLEPKTPTYFTAALLNSVEFGTEPGIAFLKVGDLFEQIQKEILTLKNASRVEIPSPRPILVGDVKGFLFCKNRKFANEEDLQWAELKKNPATENIDEFREKYPNTRFEAELQKLITRLIKGNQALVELRKTNDVDIADKIIIDFSDIPEIRNEAKDIKDKMLAKLNKSKRAGKKAEIVKDNSGNKIVTGATDLTPNLVRADTGHSQSADLSNQSISEQGGDGSRQVRPKRNLAQ